MNHNSIKKKWLFSFSIGVGFHIALFSIPIGSLSDGQEQSEEAGNSVSLSFQQTVSLHPAFSPEKMTYEKQKKMDVPGEQADHRKRVSTNSSSSKRSGMFDLSDYGRHVHRAISREKEYPTSAKRKRQEGSIVLKVILDKKGNLLSPPKIKTSSNNQLLDKEAIRMVNAAAPFKSLPDEFTKDSATLLIPVRFRLGW